MVLDYGKNDSLSFITCHLHTENFHELSLLMRLMSSQECYLENDLTSLFYVANSVMTLQTLYGVIPRIFAKGDMSKVLEDLLFKTLQLGAGMAGYLLLMCVCVCVCVCLFVCLFVLLIPCFEITKLALSEACLFLSL